ncbi:MAG: hypothetical protein QG608_2086 [Actinomycetota bacterium]|nr:hypothetical protein [Actinomycetota bacterium]
MSRGVVLGIGLALGAVGYLGLAHYVWRYRAAAGGRGLAGFLLGVFLWSTCQAIEVSCRTVASAEIWSGLKYVGIVMLAPGLWSFVTAYTGQSGALRRRTLLLMTIEPVIVLTMLALPQTRELIHYYQPADIQAGELPRAPVAKSGSLFWVHTFYSYGLLLSGIGLLVARLMRISGPYRRQARVITVACILPFIGNVIYNTRPDLTGKVDTTPYLFPITAITLVWGFFRLRLLDLVPMARGAVLDQMLDGVLVLDVYDRVVDANPAGAALLGLRRADLVGREVQDLVPPAARLLAEHRPGGTERGSTALRQSGSALAVDLEMSLSSLADNTGAQTGRLLVLRDVTESVAIQRRMRELLDEQIQLAETLQTSLRPGTLPTMPGVRLAARSVPAGQSSLVSGDFYDVHQAAGGEWAFVLGDVSGKGVHAAVLTSMARYTVRTLSAQGWSPREVLEQLNDALAQPREDERFCTVVYGRVTTPRTEAPQRSEAPQKSEGEGAADGDAEGEGLRIVLALGGHPQPLVRRKDGTVEAVGRPGTVLGLLSQVDVPQTVVRLRPGEVLLAFTDGVTEARRGGEQFGETRLSEVLAQAASGLLGTPGLAAAELVAEAVAERVLDAVRNFALERDDIAVLVLAAA